MPGARTHDAARRAGAGRPARGLRQPARSRRSGPSDEPPSTGKALQVLVSRTRAATDPGLVVRDGQGYRLGDLPVDVRTVRAHAARGRPRPRGRRRRSAPVTQARAALATPGRRRRRDGHRAAGRAAPGGAAGRATAPGRCSAERSRRPVSTPRRSPFWSRWSPPTPTTRRCSPPCSAARPRSAACRPRWPATSGTASDVRDSLGTDPGPALQALHAELLVHDRPVREGLLHDATRLIGRDDDVAAVAATIRSSRVTSILGPGGLGKTRLAHVVGRLAEQPVVHFVELAGVTTPDGVAVEVGSALGVRDSVAARRLAGTAERNDLHRRILEQLGATPTLLILDNCEHVVEAVADLVAVLVARAPALRVLTTTRAPLGMAGERVYMLPKLGRDDAVELFRERATSARPGVRLEDARGRVARRAARRAAAGGRAGRGQGPGDVGRGDRAPARGPVRAAARAAAGRRPSGTRRCSRSSTGAGTCSTDAERVALRRLAGFRDGFSLAAAAEVVDVADPVPLVTALVDQSLVDVHETLDGALPAAGDGARVRPHAAGRRRARTTPTTNAYGAGPSASRDARRPASSGATRSRRWRRCGPRRATSSTCSAGASTTPTPSGCWC